MIRTLAPSADSGNHPTRFRGMLRDTSGPRGPGNTGMASVAPGGVGRERASLPELTRTCRTPGAVRMLIKVFLAAAGHVVDDQPGATLEADAALVGHPQLARPAIGTPRCARLHTRPAFSGQSPRRRTGRALYGNVTRKDGLVEQSNFHDYRPLRIGEMPEIKVFIVPSGEKPTGVGELGVPVIAPAVGNALVQLGRPRSTLSLPFHRPGTRGVEENDRPDRE